MTAPAEPPALPAYVHVAEVAGTRVASARFLDSQWASVRQLLGPAGVRLTPHDKPAPLLPAVLETRADRSALSRWAVPGAVNVFVVESLADVDEPGRQRLGVHWRAGGTHFVIVATYGVPGGRACPPQYTCRDDSGLLAHELGHFFGLAHDERADNLMSYTRAGNPIWLADRQLRTVRARLDYELRAGRLRPEPQN